MTLTYWLGSLVAVPTITAADPGSNPACLPKHSNQNTVVLKNAKTVFKTIEYESIRLS